MLIEILCGVLATTTIFSSMLVYYSLKRITQYEELILKIKSSRGYIIPNLDAGRNEIYFSVFDCNYKKIQPTNFKELKTTSFEKYLDSESVQFVGNANNKLKNFLNSDNAIFSKKELPSSLEMASLSFEKFSKNQFVDIENFEPNYLKNFIKK